MESKSIRVLLADDEATIARIYSKVLPLQFARQTKEVATLEQELFGGDKDDAPAADITVCRQGDEAVQAALDAIRNGDPFDVVVLDICMPPGIDGVEAAKAIRAVDPDVCILFVSGYSEYNLEKLETTVPPPSRLGFMAKPVKVADLARQITAFV